MRLNVKVGDVIISARTGDAYKVVELGYEVKCLDLQGHGVTYLLSFMITNDNFYFA